MNRTNRKKITQKVQDEFNYVHRSVEIDDALQSR